MKKKQIVSLLVSTVGVWIVQGNPIIPDLTSEEIERARNKFAGAVYLDSAKPTEERVVDLVGRMTLDEKIAYLGGTGFINKKVIGETQPIVRLGIPKFKMTDATLGSKLTDGATLFPGFISLAASFNPELSYQYGRAVAEQCKAGGYRILLGPGVNLYRVPHCGRNFEYLGEDPYLTSSLVVPYIKTGQDAGVLATVKHLTANNSETFRKSSNSVIDERTLHEIYFPPFVAAIQEADVQAVMASYNLLNGEWAAENKWLITDMLRKKWGFDGLVMTDWWSVYNAEKLMVSGVDIEMPKAQILAVDNVKNMLDKGVVTEKMIDERVACILRPCIDMGLLDAPHAEPAMRERWPEHRKVAEQVAREGIVLLKNSESILPLDRHEVKNVVLFGNNASNTVATGGGAAGFDPGEAFITYEQAIRTAAGNSVEVSLVTGLKENKIRNADVVLFFLTMIEHESMDRNFDFDEDQLFALQQVARMNPNTIAVVSLGGGAEMASWVDDVKALIYAWYPGTYGAAALGEVIFGEINPSGKLPISIEKKAEDTHYYGNFLPEGMVLPRTFPGWLGKGPRLDIRYREGIFTGYRWYDSKKIDPLFPFGYGLSYTTFSLEKPVLSKTTLASGEELQISVNVTNTGAMAGAEVVQLYVSDVQASVPRPAKELKGFRKVFLQPGESKTVTLTLTERDLSFWDVEDKGWKAEAGRFLVHVGTSSRHNLQTAVFSLKN